MSESIPSPIASLKQAHDQIAAKLYLDLPVPRYDNPQIIVRYRAIGQDDIDKAVGKVRRVQGSKARSEVALKAQAAGLVEACKCIYAVVGGEKYTLDESDPSRWIPFDPDNPGLAPLRFDELLGQALGVQEQNSIAVAKELFHTDGDLLQHAAKLSEWSGFAFNQTLEEFAGE